MGVVRYLEQFLSPNDDWIEDDRRVLFDSLDGLGGHTFTREKGTDDYITTADVSSDVVEQTLADAGYQRNLASTRKYRTHHSGGKQWAVGSWVYDPPQTDTQHHVYLFPSKGGGTDIYGHFETSVRAGKEHITDTEQVHGDPNGRVADALQQADIEHTNRLTTIDETTA